MEEDIRRLCTQKDGDTQDRDRHAYSQAYICLCCTTICSVDTKPVHAELHMYATVSPILPKSLCGDAAGLAHLPLYPMTDFELYPVRDWGKGSSSSLHSPVAVMGQLGPAPVHSLVEVHDRSRWIKPGKGGWDSTGSADPTSTPRTDPSSSLLL